MGHHGLARAVAVFALSLVVDVIRALRRLEKVGTPAFYKLWAREKPRDPDVS